MSHAAPSNASNTAAISLATLPPHSTAEIAALADRYLTPNYRNVAPVFVRGEGPYNISLEQERYLDFSAGVAVNALGHNHPDLVAALRDQAALLIHQSNYWHNAHAAPLAEALCLQFSRATNGLQARCYFCNSGAEGTEAAVKLARRYHSRIRGQERPGIITFEGSFHGRTFAAMTATAQPKYQDGFAPLLPGFAYAKFGDLASVQALLDDPVFGPTVGAVAVEIVQGEGGVRLAPPGFFQQLRALCDDRGLLLMLDEVQTGLGRTGSFFAFEQEGIVPDVLWLAKALGGGVPVGAVLAREEVAQALQPGTHASTFGANALVTAVGRVILQVFERDGLVAHSAQMGAYLLAELKKAFAGRPYVTDIRGRGLMCGVEITSDPKPVVDAARRRHLLLSVAGTRVLRLTPPLIVDRAHCDEAVAALLAAADEVLG